MDTYQHLKTFSLVAAAGGFSEAARQLEVVPSVVAKRIAQLEAQLDTRLFERTTRSVRLTEAGERLYARAGLLIEGLDELMRSVGRDESKLEGHIRVMAPTTLTMTRLGEMFCEFLAQHERITMDIALVDRSTNPIEEGFDLAISGRSATYEGVVDVPLCPVEAVLCAAPGYLERRGVPAQPRELIEHDCLAFRPTGPSWQFQSNRGSITVDLRPRLMADDNGTLLRAARSGLGITSLPMYVAQDALADGTLVQLLERFPLQATWFRAYVPRRKQATARVAALVDWLASRLQTR